MMGCENSILHILNKCKLSCFKLMQLYEVIKIQKVTDQYKSRYGQDKHTCYICKIACIHV